MSSSTVLITVTGCKSGKTYSIPVNYRQEADILWVTSRRDRTWWRNLRGGAPVSALLGGRTLQARGEVIEDEKEVSERLADYFRKAPQIAKYFQVSMDPSGQPVQADCDRAARERVMVKIVLH
jgi:hypothetical protein